MSVGPDSEGPSGEELMRLGAGIVAAYVSRNAVTADAVPDIIRTVHQALDRKSTRLNSSHVSESRMPSSA